MIEELQHKGIGEGEQHVIHNLKFGTIGERDSYVPIEEDLYKVCLVLNPFGFFALSGINPIKWESMGASESGNNLIAEVTLNTTQTSVIIDGLDINLHKSYKVEIENVSNGASYIHCFINEDNTLANYDCQQTYASNSTISTSYINAPRIGFQSSEDNASSVSATIHKSGNGLITFESLSNSDRNEGFIFFGRKKTSVENLTKITLTHVKTMGFNVGTKIRIYKGDK